MPIPAYSPIRDDNALITPGDIRIDDPKYQQIVNAIRQLMADLAGFSLSGSIDDLTVDTLTVNTAVSLPANQQTGYLFGLTLSNAADAVNDITAAAGWARDSTDVNSMVLASALTKRLDATWAVGTNQGGRMSAAAIADTTYHIHLIKRIDTGVVDVGFDVSATAPTMPTNYTLFRRIGSIIRAGATILAFTQVGDEFIHTIGVQDINVANPGTSANTRVLSVPLGVKVLAHIRPSVQVNAAAAATSSLLLTTFDQSDVVPGTSNATLTTTKQAANNFTACGMRIMTATDGSIRSRLSASDANTALFIYTDGWTDTRGRSL